MSNTSPIAIEERIYGDSTWIAIRARGAEWSLFTPDEAARIGRQLAEKYSAAEQPQYLAIAAE